MDLFEKLGFTWDRYSIPAAKISSVDRAIYRYKQMLPEFVWDASVLEGNPFTFPEVKTLLDGVTVGGRSIEDQEQVLNLSKAAKCLFSMVQKDRFQLDKATFIKLHALVAYREALEWGVFRGEGEEAELTPKVSLGAHGHYEPLPTVNGAPHLNRVFESGVDVLQTNIDNPTERGMAFFLFGAMQQFYFDGNKRTSRFMMNGILMQSGVDAISVPASQVFEFNEKMVRFYLDKDATEMMIFLVDCSPESVAKDV